MIARRTLCFGVVALGLGACSRGGEDNEKGPPSISFGSDTCDRCSMVIGDERHAAAFRQDDDWLLFDDCGEMIAVASEQASGTVIAWVHDFESREWLDALTATYVWIPDRNTPMGTGIIAYSDATRAEAKANETGGWYKDWAAMITEGASE